MKTKIRRSKKKPNHYFTKDHENAIIEYCNTECSRRKTQIYVTMLQPAFSEIKPEKGHKAFSYFSVITKNWFIHKVKKQQRKNRREVDFDNVSKSYEEEYLSTDQSWLNDKIQEEFWNSFYRSMKTWNIEELRENDERVYKAIIVLFESKDDIEIFNKKAIYLYLREITGLNTKQVVNSLNKFRGMYREFKNEWENGQI